MSARAKKTAVILSGGGANGAYEIGVLRALAEGRCPSTHGRPLEPEILSGASVGAYNATVLAACSDRSLAEAVAELEKLWCRRVAHTATSCGNGVYRLRADPRRFMDLGCLLRDPAHTFSELLGDAAFWTHFGVTRGEELAASDKPIEVRALELVDLSSLFSVEPLHELVLDTIDLDSLRRTPCELYVAVSDWQEGEVRVYTKEDVVDVDRFGPRVIVASSALPGVFPPVEIDNSLCVDGGLLMNSPLDPALRAGANTVHLVVLEPEVARQPLPDVPNSFDTAFRMFNIITYANLRSELKGLKRVNGGLDLIDQWGRTGKPSAINLAQADLQVEELKDLAHAIYYLREHYRRRAPYRRVEVHRYVPRESLGDLINMLDFRVERIEALIERGYQDALHHDCEHNDCIVP